MPFDTSSGGNLSTQGPDFDRIKSGDLLALTDGLRLLWTQHQEMYRQLVSRAPVVPITITPIYATSMFGVLETGTGGAWSVDAADVTIITSQRTGDWMTVAFNIVDTNVVPSSGIVAALTLYIPNRVKANARVGVPILATDDGVAAIGMAYTSPGDDRLFFFTTPDAISPAWTATSGNNTSVAGVITFPVRY